MAGETTLTIIGNLTDDPDKRSTRSGDPVVNVSIASTPRTYDRQSGEWRDGETLFMRCTVWGNSGAVNVAESLRKGDRVIAHGSIAPNSYTTRDGAERTTIDMTVDEIGPSLKWATAVPEKVSGGGSRGRGRDDGEQWGRDRQRGRDDRGGGRQQRDDRRGRDDRQQQGGGYDDPWGSAPPPSGGPYDDDEPPF